jgi:hypothetical protein
MTLTTRGAARMVETVLLVRWAALSGRRYPPSG